MHDMQNHSKLGKRYICQKNIVIRKIGDVFLLIPVKTIPSIKLEQFIVTNNIGAMIWESCFNGDNADQIMTKIETSFSVDRTVAQSDVCNVINTFCDLELLFEVPYEL